MKTDKIQDIRAELETQKTSAARQLEEHGASTDPEAPVEVESDDGFADSGQAASERSELVASVEALRLAYAEASAALARIDDGTFGVCERCGRAIPEERLEALPTATLCVDCKQAVSAGA